VKVKLTIQRQNTNEFMAQICFTTKLDKLNAKTNFNYAHLKNLVVSRSILIIVGHNSK